MLGRRRRRGWSVGGELGPEWYPLPVGSDRDDLRAAVATFLADGAPAALGRPMPADEAGRLAAEVTGWCDVVEEMPGVVDAAVLRTEFDGPVEALLTMSLSGWPRRRSLQAWVEEYLAGAAAEVTEEQLPVGPALRVHQEGEVDPDTGARIEAVGHLFRAPDGDVVWHQLAWEGQGDHRFCDTADALAAGLVFTRADG
ncbi:hypothetical protein [Nocardioides caldifontis]|uniref:hypothetical protein n=1 Tax=Nocardioides caldifontis TaxID=2588938 RepID=UPI0013969A37|nr:hypothetical protein [Nocardioides caldifontis]